MKFSSALIFFSLLTIGCESNKKDTPIQSAFSVGGKWMISDVQYENLVLQFFGEIAVLTYRNIVKEKDEMGLPKTWHFTWADVWVKEDGEWKIKAGYGIHGNESNKKASSTQSGLPKNTMAKRKYSQ